MITIQHAKVHIIRKIDEGQRILKLGNRPLDLTVKQLAEAFSGHKISIHLHAMTRRKPQKKNSRIYPSKLFPKLYFDEVNQVITEMPRQWVDIGALYKELEQLPEYVTPRLRPNKYFVIDELEGHNDVTFQPFPYGWVLTNMDGRPMMEFTNADLISLRNDPKLVKLGAFNCPVVREESWKYACPIT